MLTAASAAMGFPDGHFYQFEPKCSGRLATVVIGGLITSTLLTMIALPLLFMIFNDEEGVEIQICPEI